MVGCALTILWTDIINSLHYQFILEKSPEELLVSIYMCSIISLQIKSQAQIVSAE